MRFQTPASVVSPPYLFVNRWIQPGEAAQFLKLDEEGQPTETLEKIINQQINPQCFY